MVGKGIAGNLGSELRIDVDASEKVYAGGRNILSQRPSMQLPQTTLGTSGPLKPKVSFDMPSPRQAAK